MGESLSDDSPLSRSSGPNLSGPNLSGQNLPDYDKTHSIPKKKQFGDQLPPISKPNLKRCPTPDFSSGFRRPYVGNTPESDIRPQPIPTISSEICGSKSTTKLSAFHLENKKIQTKRTRGDRLRRRADSPFSRKKAKLEDSLESLSQDSQEDSNRGKSSESIKKINNVEARESPGYMVNKKFTENLPDKIIK